MDLKWIIPKNSCERLLEIDYFFSQFLQRESMDEESTNHRIPEWSLNEAKKNGIITFS